MRWEETVQVFDVWNQKGFGDVMKNSMDSSIERKDIIQNKLCFWFGLVIAVLSVVSYDVLFSRIDFDIMCDDVLLLLIPIAFFVVGIAVLYSSLRSDSKAVKVILVILLWIGLSTAFMDERIMVAVIILGISITFFILSKVFGKILSTMITLGICIGLGTIPFYFLLVYVIKKLGLVVSEYALCNGALILCIVFYLWKGVKFNKLCLKILGYGNDQISQYNYSELRNQVNIMYLIAFVAQNLNWQFNNVGGLSDTANVINNALITGVCITNVKWESIFWK